MITIYINEKLVSLEKPESVFTLRDKHKPEADILIYNGAVCSSDTEVKDGDKLVLIKRGEIPDENELQYLMAARHTPGVHTVLQNSVVGIAGLGGLGSAVAVALARIGVGRLIIADFDIVEPSNLNRQQYFIEQLGTPKTEALSENLKRINPYVSIESHTVRLDKSNITDVFSDVDVLVEAFDTADAKAMLVEFYGREKPDVPVVTATGLAGHAPGNTVLTRKLGRNLYVIGDLITAAQPGTGLMAPRVGIAAHHQANAVLRLLLGEDPVQDR